MLFATIMAGGAGTRFWPASRRAMPKQLLALTGERTLLQETFNRLAGICTPERTLVLTNQRLIDAVSTQLGDLDRTMIIGEPCKRDTAPCIALAAHLVMGMDPHATMLVMPADHVIRDVRGYQQAIQYAQRLIRQDPNRLVTFGIRPTCPSTAFGYVRRGNRIGADAPPAYEVSRFQEKPDQDTADEYLRSGDYYWNSGIFVWRAEAILGAVERFEPEIAKRTKNIAEAWGGESFSDVLQADFARITAKSIDYAVMEKDENVVVIEAPFDWDDVGNWSAVPRLRGIDEDGNTCAGRHLTVDTRNTLVRTDDKHLVVTLGVADLIVVHTDDATLIASKDHEQSLREIVDQLDGRGWTEYL